MANRSRKVSEEEVDHDLSQFGLLNDGIGNDCSYSLSQTRSGYWTKLFKTMTLCAAYFSLGLCMSVTGPTLPFLQEQVGSTISQVSYIFTARSIGVLSGSFMGGVLMDRYNPYSLLFIVVALMAIGIGAMPWCRHLWLLMVSSSLIGIGGGFLDTGTTTLCLELWGQGSGPYMQALHFNFALGGSVAPLMVQAFIVDSSYDNETFNSHRHVRSTSDSPYSTISGNSSFNSSTIIKAQVANISLSPPNGTLKTDLLAVTTSSTVLNLAASNSSLEPNKRPKKPKPEVTNGESFGDSRQFDHIPLINDPSVHKDIVLLELASTTTESAPTTTAATRLSTANSSLNKTSEIATSTARPVGSSKSPTVVSETTIPPPAPPTLSSRPVTTAAAEEVDTSGGVVMTFEKYGVTRMHMLYTVIAIIVLHVAFSFLFFLCSTTRLPATVQPTARKVHSSRPPQKLLFIGLLFVFYLSYVGSEVSYGQFIATFALKSQLKLSLSTANYVTITFWASFAATRFISIFIAHFFNPTSMLFLNLGLCSLGSISLCIGAQTSLTVLYVGSAILGVAMASTFATGFLWTESRLTVTHKISSAFSIASALGEMIFPTLVGLLMDDEPMALMYLIFTSNVLCVATFVAAWFMTSRWGNNSAYQSNRQVQNNS